MNAARTKAVTWLPFALCLLLTAAASAFVGRAELHAARARLTNDINTVRAQIVDRMGTYIGVLRGGSGLFSHEELLTADQFRRFVDHLGLRTNYPGTQGIGYSKRFGRVSIAEATARARAEVGTDLRVWPATPRDDVHAIIMLEPLDARNRAAFGYDMFTDPVRRDAMERARDSGDVVLSGKVRLVQEISTDKQAGFLLYSPVYAGGVVPASVEERRARLEGYVYMPLRAGDLFAGIFGDARAEVAFELYDGVIPSPEHRLVSYGRAISADDEVTTAALLVAGHVWTARFVPASTTPTPLLAALRVAAFGALLTAFVFVVTRARERARDRAVRANAAALASEQTARLRELFVGVLGHDLTNPLHAIGLGLGQLVDHLADDPAALAVLARVRASTDRMARMIEQILDLTRIRLGGGIRIEPTAMDLGTLAREIADEVVQATPRATVTVDTRGELTGTWDPDRLGQVLANLVGNAVRHRRDEAVRVTVDGAEPDRVVVAIHNAGVIPASVLPEIFEPFRGTATGARSRTPGLGLGLYITRALVTAHAGSIEVTSGDAEGTTFTVVLPRTTAPPLREPHGISAQLATA